MRFAASTRFPYANVNDWNKFSKIVVLIIVPISASRARLQSRKTGSYLAGPCRAAFVIIVNFYTYRFAEIIKGQKSIGKNRFQLFLLPLAHCRPATHFCEDLGWREKNATAINIIININGELSTQPV